MSECPIHCPLRGRSRSGACSGSREGGPRTQAIPPGLAGEAAGSWVGTTAATTPTSAAEEVDNTTEALTCYATAPAQSLLISHINALPRSNILA